MVMGVLFSLKCLTMWLEKKGQMGTLKLGNVMSESLGCQRRAATVTIAPLSVQQNNCNLPHLWRRLLEITCHRYIVIQCTLLGQEKPGPSQVSSMLPAQGMTHNMGIMILFQPTEGQPNHEYQM